MANRYQGERHTTLIRVPVDLHEALATEAQREGISLNAYMLRLILAGRKQEAESGRASLQTAG